MIKNTACNKLEQEKTLKKYLHVQWIEKVYRNCNNCMVFFLVMAQSEPRSKSYPKPLECLEEDCAQQIPSIFDRSGAFWQEKSGIKCHSYDNNMSVVQTCHPLNHLVYQEAKNYSKGDPELLSSWNPMWSNISLSKLQQMVFSLPTRSGVVKRRGDAA